MRHSRFRYFSARMVRTLRMQIQPQATAICVAGQLCSVTHVHLLHRAARSYGVCALLISAQPAARAA